MSIYETRRAWILGSFHFRPGGQFGTLDDKFDCISSVPGEVTQSLNWTVVAQDAQEADGDVAEAGHDLRCFAGMNATGILAKVDIAYPMQAILDSPVPAKDGCEVFGVRPTRRQAGNTEAHRDSAGPAALVDAVALDPEDLLQAGPTTILGGQGAGGLQVAHFDAAAMQVNATGGGNRLGHHPWLTEQDADVVT